MAMITLGDCSILTVVLSFNSFSITSIRQSFCSGSKLEKYNFFWLIFWFLLMIQPNYKRERNAITIHAQQNTSKQMKQNKTN